mmetsp:Transcript_46728/g.47195  ORF Transcript_46728/g.47195 Transcript_46728/m.47195 type:complete len:109 (-) Transcript_46728:441-767(-)
MLSNIRSLDGWPVRFLDKFRRWECRHHHYNGDESTSQMVTLFANPCVWAMSSRLDVSTTVAWMNMHPSNKLEPGLFNTSSSDAPHVLMTVSTTDSSRSSLGADSSPSK